jgi:LPXTG-site transpeptidase (sortase) family protein
LTNWGFGGKIRPMIFPAGIHQVDLFVNFQAPSGDQNKNKGERPVLIESFKSESGQAESEVTLSILSFFKFPSLVPSFVDFKKRFDKPIFSQILGLIIFLASFIGVSLTIGPIVAAEVSYRISQFKKETARVVKHEPPKPKKVYVTDFVDKVTFENIPAPVDPNFGIVIPKIGVNVKVVPNVSTSREKEYLRALQKGVAHAAGSALPNEEGIVFLFGHSALHPWDIIRFNAVFYQIKDLEVGDEVNVFYNSHRYYYKVTEKRIVNPYQTEFLSNPLPGRTLVLQTCWPLGTTKQRLLVFARPVGAEAKSDSARLAGQGALAYSLDRRIFL